jgi:hypothetical protein
MHGVFAFRGDMAATVTNENFRHFVATANLFLWTKSAEARQKD